MPFEIKLPQLFAGCCLESKTKTDTSVKIQVMEFTSSQDGEHFIERLEGFPDQILSALPGGTFASRATIDACWQYCSVIASPPST